MFVIYAFPILSSEFDTILFHRLRNVLILQIFNLRQSTKKKTINVCELTLVEMKSENGSMMLVDR